MDEHVSKITCKLVSTGLQIFEVLMKILKNLYNVYQKL